MKFTGITQNLIKLYNIFFHLYRISSLEMLFTYVRTDNKEEVPVRILYKHIWFSINQQIIWMIVISHKM